MPGNFDSEPEKSGRDQAGRWAQGYSGNRRGKPPGARHAALVALDAIGEAGATDALRVVVTAAKGGDMRAAEILLKRVWPERKGRPIRVALSALRSASDIGAALGMIVGEVGRGALTPDEGEAIANLLEAQRRAVETADLERRVVALEDRGPGKATD